MNKLVSIAVVFSLLASAGGFQSTKTYLNDLEGKAPTKVEEKESQKVGVRGVVKEINAGKDGVIILVEGNFSEDTLYDKAYVLINIETIISKDNLKRLYSISEIQVGNTVEVFLTGPVAESYPVHGKAQWVRIVSQ